MSTDQWTVLAGGGVIAGMAIYGAYMLTTGESLGVVSLASEHSCGVTRNQSADRLSSTGISARLNDS